MSLETPTFNSSPLKEKPMIKTEEGMTRVRKRISKVGCPGRQEQKELKNSQESSLSEINRVRSE